MDINKLLNTTLAGQIAKKLDAKDDNSDGKISGSVWNQFVGEIGTGKTISENGFISIENAMNSITIYAVRLSKQEGKSVNELAKEWLNKYNDTQQTPKTEDTLEITNKNKTKETAGSKKEQPVKKTDKYSTNDIKVTIKPMYLTKEAKDIYKSRKEGAALKDYLKKGIIEESLTMNNAAYALGSTQFGPNTQKQAKCVFELLVAKIYALELQKDGDIGNVHVFEKLSYKEQNKLIIEYKNRIIKHETNLVKKAENEKASFNKDISKMQESFDKANQVLVNTANNPEKAKIITNKDGSKTAILSNGQWIRVIYENNKISEIRISHNTSKNTKAENGSMFDGDEVSYTKDYAYVDTYENNDIYEHSITSGYDFEKLKKLSEVILGK